MARSLLHGFAVSSGIAVGRAFFLNRRPDSVRHEEIPLSAAEAEIERLRLAVASVARDFQEAKLRLPAELAEQAEVIDSHLLICNDPKLGKEAERRIREQRMSAEWALEESLAAVEARFRRMNSPYISDRMQDIRMVADRILGHLRGTPEADPAGQEGRVILLAHDLSPADTLNLSLDRIFSFATEEGGKTAHTGILARSLRIPAVVGVSGLEAEARDGDLIIVDGLRGKILVEPDEAELAAYALTSEQYNLYQERLKTSAAAPAETEDGYRIAVLANVETAIESEGALAAGAEGIGLVRTEFGVITRGAMPKEDELYAEYLRIAAAVAPAKVTFRTLDLGAEKIFGDRKTTEEANPALGLRAIRYCLRHQDFFRRQLKALLRASVHGNVAIMFPMISDVAELRQAKAVLNEARQELDDAGISFDPEVLVGIMVELPSAVLIADILAPECDFFSIGSNDLLQYTLGADRENKHLGYLHDPLHPGIIRAIKQVIEAAHRSGIPVSICGEMGSDPYSLPLLIGMSIDEISVPPQAVAGVKHLIRQNNAEECRALISRAWYAPTARVVGNLVKQTVYTRFPDDISFFISQSDSNG